jgi:hypothetical protein
MCLYKVDKKTRKRNFSKHEYVNSDIYYNGKRIYNDIDLEKSCLPTEQWIEDTCLGEITSETGEEYITGFHVFQSYKQAKKWADLDDFCERKQVICKVFMDNIVASGIQDASSGHSRFAIVFVARKIYIEKPE